MENKFLQKKITRKYICIFSFIFINLYCINLNAQYKPNQEIGVFCGRMTDVIWCFKPFSRNSNTGSHNE